MKKMVRKKKEDKKSISNVLKFITMIAVSLLAGFIGSIFTTPSIAGWYRELVKPNFSPPNWIFAPVWICLYLLMGIAAFLVWRKQGKGMKMALTFFFIQLALNSLWSIIFFGAHNIMLAFFEIIILWIAILITTIRFFKISKPAGWLMLPYIAWVSFATVLNLAFWILNL